MGRARATGAPPEMVALMAETDCVAYPATLYGEALFIWAAVGWVV